MHSITRNQAINLLKETGVSEEIIAHAQGVARRAASVCQMLEAGGYTVYTERVVLASLLHDIGLGRPHGLDFGAVSAETLEEIGLTDLAEIVRIHAWPPSTDISLEAKVLIYANLGTGPDGNPVEHEIKLEFLRSIAENCSDKRERFSALKALQVKRLIVKEIDELLRRSMGPS